MKKAPNPEFSFQKGWSKLQYKDVKSVRNELMRILNVNRMTLYRRRVGYVEPRVSEAKVIEGIFHKYGVTDIWGAAIPTKNQSLNN